MSEKFVNWMIVLASVCVVVSSLAVGFLFGIQYTVERSIITEDDGVVSIVVLGQIFEHEITQ